MPRSPLTYRHILTFWLPLATTWLMMAVEGPYLAAIIARLEQPTENLAAFGVAFAFAIIIEAPVIMLMAASTALVRDGDSYRALRRFTLGLSVALTGVQLVVVAPPVFDWIAELGQVQDDEMYRVFNMGIGFVLVLDPYYVESVQRRLDETRTQSWVIGQIEPGTTGVEMTGS